jgi:uncharacterized protein YndB with AHSA1/START domain
VWSLAHRLADEIIREEVERAPKLRESEVTMNAQGNENAFVYTTYILASPERVWQGLTDPDLMKRYWRHQSAGPKAFLSDWKTGSTYEMTHEEVGLIVRGSDQVILESDPYHRSKVAFDIEDVGHGTARLTVTHDDFQPGSAVLPAISEGWPAVLSSLKSLLETGSSLRTS